MVEPLPLERLGQNQMALIKIEEEEKIENNLPHYDILRQRMRNFYCPDENFGDIEERDVEEDSWKDQSRQAAAAYEPHDSDQISGSVPYGDRSAIMTGPLKVSSTPIDNQMRECRDQDAAVAKPFESIEQDLKLW